MREWRKTIDLWCRVPVLWESTPAGALLPFSRSINRKVGLYDSSSLPMGQG